MVCAKICQKSLQCEVCLVIIVVKLAKGKLKVGLIAVSTQKNLNK